MDHDAGRRSGVAGLGILGGLLALLATYVVPWFHVTSATDFGVRRTTYTLQNLRDQFPPLPAHASYGVSTGLYVASPIVMSVGAALLVVGGLMAFLFISRGRLGRLLPGLTIVLGSACILYITFAVGVPWWPSREPLAFARDVGWWLGLSAGLLGAVACVAAALPHIRSAAADQPSDKILAHT